MGEPATRMTRVDLSATNFAVLHNRPVRCHADCSPIFADFELAFASPSCARQLCQHEVDAAFEVFDQETYAPPSNIQLFGHSLFAL